MKHSIKLVRILCHHITTTILPKYLWNWQTTIGDLYDWQTTIGDLCESGEEATGTSLTFAIPNDEGTFTIILKIDIFGTTIRIIILHNYRDEAHKILDLNDPNSIQMMDKIIIRTLNRIKQKLITCHTQV